MSRKVSSKINRRDFLRMLSIASAGGVLAACAPAATQAPAAAPTSAPQAAAATNTSAPVAAAPTNTSAPAVVPTTAAPSAAQITITYGRHDDVAGGAQSVKEFEALYPNIKVEQQMIGDFANKEPAMAAAGSLPDVFRSWEAMCLDLARAQQIVVIQPYVDADPNFKPDDFYQNWWNWPVIDGKRYGVPDVIAPHVTMYNVDLFDKKTVDYPNKDSFTWDDYVQKALKISDVPNKVWGSETIPVGWTYWSLKLIRQNGGDFFTPDFTKCIIDSPEAIEAIQFWADQLLGGKVMPSPSQIVDVGGAGDEATLMAAGKIGMMHDGVWNVNTLISAKIKFNLVPEPSKKIRDTITHGAFNTIPTTTKDKDSAWKWLDYVCSTKGIYNYGLVGKFPGGRKSSNLITPHPWVVDLPYTVDWDVVPQALDYGHVLPGPANEGQALKIIGDALQKIYAGDGKAQDLFPQIVPQVTAVLTS
jgi:multiple sugar transport system substrate-binding protein